MNVVKLLRLLYWDLAKKNGRFSYWEFFIGNLPGKFGEEIRRIIMSPHFKSVGKNLRLFPGLHIRNADKITLGDNVLLGYQTLLAGGGGIKIGNDTMIGPKATIFSISHNYKDTKTAIMDQGSERNEVIIGNNVWIATNTFIMPGAEIGDWCVISAGSVVGGKQIPPYTILAGNPARKIGELQAGANTSASMQNE